VLSNGLSAAESSGNVKTGLPAVPLRELGYVSRNWNVEHGLPKNNITALAQASDGYLWVGTFSGPVRFDGVRFRVFDRWHYPQLQSAGVAQLLSANEGRVWMRTGGGFLALWEHGDFAAIPFLNPPPFPAAIGLDRNGDLLLAPPRGARVESWTGGQLKTIVSAAGTETISAIFSDAQNQLWCRMGNQNFKVNDGALEPVTPANAALGELFLRRDGALAVLTPEGIWEHGTNQWRLARAFSPVIADEGWANPCEDSDGVVWFTLSSRLGASVPDGRTVFVDLPDATVGLRVQKIILGREASLWLATEPGGLFRLQRAEFRTVSSADGLSPRRVTAVCSDGRSGAWVTCGNQLRWISAARAVSKPLLTNAINPRSLAPVADGGLWCADLSGRVFKVTLGRGAEQVADLRSRANVLFESRDHSLWAGSAQGLARWNGGEFVGEKFPNDARSAPTALAEDARGRIYAAGEQGLFRRESGRWHRLTRPEDQGATRIVALTIESNGTVWATATHPGLARWKEGQWFPFEDESVLPSSGAGLTLDGGGLWLATDRGVARFELSELNRWADGGPEAHAIWFDREEGLGSIDCSDLASGVSKSADGLLWFATDNGVSVTEAKRALDQRSKTLPPPVHIEDVLIDDKPVAARGVVTLPPNAHRVEFRFTGISLSAPEKSTFAYRLNGFEQSWVNAGTRRAAYYQKLPPGEYRFQVMAANKHQVWNRDGASMDLTVQPAWWQTSLARAGFGAAGVGFLACVYIWRVNRLKRARAQQEEFTRKLISSQEEERKRIAGELHDSLGQNLLILKNRLYLANEQAASGARPTQFAELNDVVSQAIAEVREISLNLRPYQIERLGLTKSLQATVRKISDATRMKIGADIHSVDGLFAPADEIHFFRIIQESLNNVVKHADASAVSLSVQRHDGHVVVRLEDDGRGFDYAGLMNDPKLPRGLGLSGLAERARIMGGTFHCESAPGAGTRLMIEIPAAKISRHEDT